MNQLTIVGTVKHIPDFKTTSNGLNFSNIIIESLKNNEKTPEEFLITFWNQNLEYIKSNVSNGDKVYIKAHLKANNYNKDNNEILYRSDIVGERIHLIH